MRSLLRVGSVLLILGMLVLVGRSWSDTKPPPAPRTRIALINLAQVIKQYEKIAVFQAEVKELLEPFQGKAKGIQKQIEVHTKELQQTDLQPDKRMQLEKNLRNFQRQLEDLNAEAKAFWAKKNDEQMLIFYKEVMDAAQRYARAHDFDLVMHYNDATPEMPEYWHPSNVSRKIQAGACVVMDVAPGMEITKEIVAALNDKYRANKKSDN
jgi:Skp family chaperone for outer membrane proteins